MDCLSDKSVICSRGLLGTFSPSAPGTPAKNFIICQNDKRLRILLAVSIHGLLALTVQEDTFNRKKKLNTSLSGICSLTYWQSGVVTAAHSLPGYDYFPLNNE
ncbi:hypothetical protein VP01_1314g2 [Puccinia sorghi]|uniref:Uncharacterized protein n=1 Tax=Puccinia sorghi TaxID=27349 RepID=A0A0L6VN13_9BASI|nr:hypothetical protein VP01_1314g2 [Puccinia sorghi]